jgi:hypothetical protein
LHAYLQRKKESETDRQTDTTETEVYLDGGTCRWMNRERGRQTKRKRKRKREKGRGTKGGGRPRDTEKGT